MVFMSCIGGIFHGLGLGPALLQELHGHYRHLIKPHQRNRHGNHRNGVRRRDEGGKGANADNGKTPALGEHFVSHDADLAQAA